jgi:hypothetical protein
MDSKIEACNKDEQTNPGFALCSDENQESISMSFIFNDGKLRGCRNIKTL